MGIAAGALALLAAGFAGFQALDWQREAMRTPLLDQRGWDRLRDKSMDVFIPWVIAAVLAVAGLILGIKTRRTGTVALIVSSLVVVVLLGLLAVFTDAVTYGL